VQLIPELEYGQDLREAERLVLRGLGDDLVPLYYLVKLNYYISALSEEDTTVRDFVKPAIRPMFVNMWKNATAEQRYLAIQAYYAFLEKTAELTGLVVNPKD